jgi:hypothetical protein
MWCACEMPKHVGDTIQIIVAFVGFSHIH